MAPATALPWILWHMLSHRDHLGTITPVDVVGDWLEHDHGDERLAASVSIFLRAKTGSTITTADGMKVAVIEEAGEPVVVVDQERATLHEMMLAARHLMAADDPPSAPVSATPAQPIRQPYPVLSTGRAPMPRAPIPVKPAAPAPRQKVVQRAPQLSLF